MTTIQELPDALAAAAPVRAAVPIAPRRRRIYELVAEAVILLVLLASASILVRP